MLANDTRTKPWGKVDKAALHKLIVDGLVDIENLEFANIDSVREQYFPHRELRNFRRNFASFAAAFDLEAAHEGARRASAANYEAGLL